ncbi:MAG: MBL fold metallo-hydrolase [Blautia marasmi]
MKITILNENTVYRQGLLAEHGLSVVIEERDRKFLMDTGQSDVFLKNAKTLGVHLEDLDGIILSHGHYDHCGGMEYLDGSRRLPPVYIQKSAFERKYSGTQKDRHYIGMSGSHESWKADVRFTGDAREIAPGFWVIGNIPYRTNFEERPAGFWIQDKNGTGTCWRADEMEDEQILAVCTKGTLSLHGLQPQRRRQRYPAGKGSSAGYACLQCTGRYASEKCGEKRITDTIRSLRDMEIPVLIPVHCTGKRAAGRMASAFGDSCIWAETGQVLEL